MFWVIVPSIMTMSDSKILLSVLRGKQSSRPPFWFMRQAGRYLPEYRALREKSGGFLSMVYNPETAAEITVQPVRRFGMDAAILFSDILVVPQALGVGLTFCEGEGPKLEALRDLSALPVLDPERFDAALEPVCETLGHVRQKLNGEGFKDRTLIGFAGAPWTICCYMIEGGGSRDFQRTKALAFSDPEGFQRLVDLIVAATTRYLGNQIRAGAETVQIFDSWAGILDGQNFARWAITPIEKITSALHKDFPGVPVIGFPRGAGAHLEAFTQQSGVDAIGLDSFVPLEWVAQNVQSVKPVQGNLDPVALLKGGAALERATHGVLESFGGKPFVFNLGHGIIKETPPEHVARLCEIVRGWTS